MLSPVKRPPVAHATAIG